jgi:predicted Zn-dependent protease
MNQMGDQAFSDMVKKQPTLSESSPEHKRVRCISDALLKAMGKNPSDWDINVFKAEEPNAFALPGNNFGVHTGMIELVDNNGQLAAVIGHEIAHVIAEHGNERASQQMAVQGGMAVAQIALGQSKTTDRLLLGAMGLGAQVGVLLPFSRKHESEADELGVKYMSQAGFDPREAPELWKKMAQKGGGPPEFLSTHPSPETRIQKLSELAPRYMDIYRANKDKSSCPN